MKHYTQLLKLAAQMDRIGLRDPADELEEAQVLQYSILVLQYLILVLQYSIPETQPTSLRSRRSYNT
jgi:hypothetical protein